MERASGYLRSLNPQKLVASLQPLDSSCSTYNITRNVRELTKKKFDSLYTRHPLSPPTQPHPPPFPPSLLRLFQSKIKLAIPCDIISIITRSRRKLEGELGSRNVNRRQFQSNLIKQIVLGERPQIISPG